MRVIFYDQAWEDYLYWQNTDKKILKRINELVRDIHRDPKSGLGKPEPLKFNLQGCWSRRINHEHRLVYELRGEEIRIVQCRFHYS